MAGLLPWLRRGAELVTIALFVTMFGLFLLQIFTRYVLGVPLGWTVEACVICYIWIVFWTSAFLVRERDHVAFTILYDHAGPGARRVYALIGAGAIGLAFVAGLPGAVDYVTFMKIESTPVTRIRFDYVYSVWILFMAAVAVRAALEIARLLGRRWRDEVADDHAPGPVQGSDPA